MGLLMVVQMDVMASICWMRALRRSQCPPSLASLSPSRWRQGALPRLQHMSMHSVSRKWRMSLTSGPLLKKVKTVLSGSTSALRSRLCAAWEKLRAPSSLSLRLQARLLEPLCVGLGRVTQGYKLVRTSRTRTPIQMTWSSPSLLLTRPAMILQLTNVNVRKIRAPRRSATPHLVGSGPTPVLRHASALNFILYRRPRHLSLDPRREPPVMISLFTNANVLLSCVTDKSVRMLGCCGPQPVCLQIVLQ